MMSAADWLTALDDVLTGRLRRCTQCRRDTGEGHFDIAEYPQLAVAFIPCARCRARDPQREALDALLRRRYGVPKGLSKIKSSQFHGILQTITCWRYLYGVDRFS